MAGIRDDSAGSYGQWQNPDDWSWLDHVKAAGSDTGNALYNLSSNVIEGLSPFAPTATQYGKPSLQVPPMLQGIADSYSRLAGTPSQPGNAYDLTGVKELDAPIQQDMSNVLLSLYGGNAAAGISKPAGSVGMFAGRNAKTADLNTLAKAEQLAGQGATRDAIWNETGWFQGPDQKWRFEIDDSTSGVLSPAMTSIAKRPSSGPIQEQVFHTPFFEAYPEASSLSAQAWPGALPNKAMGAYAEGHGVVYDALGESPRSTVLHELQHDAQWREGFSRGGDSRRITPDQIASERARLMAAPEDQWSVGNFSGDAPDSQVAHSLYNRLAGEVEARNVQKRMNMSAEERKANPPWLTQDVPFEDQIVRLFSDTGKPSLFGSALATAGEQPKGITAYHGSPHDFDKFSLDKIGTGEGAQAYGHGLYFADSENVARSYKENLSRGYSPAENTAQWALDEVGGDKASALAKLDAARAWHESNGGLTIEKAAELDAARNFITAPKGRMYQVRINADPESFLDWDKPLSQQSEAIRNALSGSFPPDQMARVSEMTNRLDALNRIIDNAGGARADAAMREKNALIQELDRIDPSVAKSPEMASALREAGIPGIRYLDGASRADGVGSSNYVVFDADLIEILKKYGLAGGAVGAGALNSLSQDPQIY